MNEHPLRSYRRQNGLSLEALAELVGDVSPSTLSRIETGLLEPSMGLVRRIVAATKLNSDKLVHPEAA